MTFYLTLLMVSGWHFLLIDENCEHQFKAYFETDDVHFVHSHKVANPFRAQE